MQTDLPILLRNATILDGSGAPARSGELFVQNGKISARQTSATVRELDLQGCYVSPGWVDLHVHVFSGYGVFSIPATEIGAFTGVTTLVDAGSAGALNYPLFEEIFRARTSERVVGYVNIASAGIPHGHAEKRGFLGDHFHSALHSEELALGLLARFSGSIAGWKIRLTSRLADNDETKERRAFEALLNVKAASELPVMIHHAKSCIPIDEVLDALHEGDVYTHCFHGYGNSPFEDESGRPTASALAARKRGVLFDVGHGVGGFNWERAEKACRDFGFWPDTISSDLHRYNLFSPVCNLANMLSKFLLMGAPLEHVIASATGNTTPALRHVNIAPSLAEGAPANLTIFQVQEGNFEFSDTVGEVRRCSQRIVPLAVLQGGTLAPCYGFHMRHADGDALARSWQSIA